MLFRVRRSAAMAAAVALLITISSCGDDRVTNPPTTGTVEGVVSDLLGNGLEAVGVILVDPATLATASLLVRTDSGGHYRIDGVTPADYAVFLYGLRCTLVSTFARTSPLVHVQAGSTAIRHERLIGACISIPETYITGTVTDALTGAPIAGAYVSDVYSAGVDRYAFVGVTVNWWDVTDATGHFSIVAQKSYDDSLTAYGILPISVTKLGYEPVTLVGRGDGHFVSGPPLPAPTPPDTALVVTVALHPVIAGAPAGALTGRVIDSSGPVAGVRVTLSLGGVADPDTMRAPTKTWACQSEIEALVPGKSAVTDEAGLFLISELHPGAYLVNAAIFADDGFVGNFQRLVEVTSSDTVNVGDITVVTALTPIAPAAGSDLAATEPIVLQWSDAPPGVQVTRYRVQYGINSYFLLDSMSTDQTWVTIGPLLARSAVRWYVEAFYVSGTDSVRVGAFEQIATFETAGP